MHILPQEAMPQAAAKTLEPALIQKAIAQALQRKAAEEFTQCHSEIPKTKAVERMNEAPHPGGSRAKPPSRASARRSSLAREKPVAQWRAKRGLGITTKNETPST